MTIDYRVGDVREQLARIPDGSVSLVASSPPFIALRSYLPDNHPHKHLEIGSEPDPAAFLDTLLGLTAEWGRVLAPWGSIAIELGDTYAGGGGQADGDAGKPQVRGSGGPLNRGGGRVPLHTGNGWPRAKSLALIPQLYATSLAYGRNLLTGQESPAGQWLVRNVIVWHRPNPAVGALGDKVRPSTSYITVATRSPKRWYDLDAVRTPVRDTYSPHQVTSAKYRGDPTESEGRVATVSHAAGAPPLDCWFDQHDTWTITTQPSKLHHFAMWPPKLAERLILMMCPLEVCQVCQQPRRRQLVNAGSPYPFTYHQGQNGGTTTGGMGGHTAVRRVETTGWSDCGHDAYTPGVVLDPFCGSGTSLCVAELHGRDSIGIDLDSRNRELLEARIVECSRSLFGTQPEMAGQMDLFGGPG